SVHQADSPQLSRHSDLTSLISRFRAAEPIRYEGQLDIFGDQEPFSATAHRHPATMAQQKGIHPLSPIRRRGLESPKCKTPDWDAQVVSLLQSGCAASCHS